MPPKDAKKDGKGEKKAAESPEEIMRQQVDALEAERDNLGVELQFMKDKLRAIKADNDRLVQESDDLKIRLERAAHDASDILDHKQVEIAQKDDHIGQLDQRVRALEEVLGEREAEMDRLRRENLEHRRKQEEAEAVIREKKELEKTIAQQELTISKQKEHMERMAKQALDQDQNLKNSQYRIEELQVRSSSHTDIKILFGEPWMVAVKRYRIKGTLTNDRAFNSIGCLGGRQLILYGGNPIQDGRNMSILNLDTLQWEKPDGTFHQAIKSAKPRAGHAATVSGRTKLYVFGGRDEQEALVSDLWVFNNDTLKWNSPTVKGTPPQPREGHSACVVREKLFIFGGMDDQALRNDMWCLDQETMQWAQVPTVGVPPTPRWGASMCASDGRKLWIVGGNDGEKSLMDVYVFELDRQVWTSISTLGHHPEAREGHSAHIVGQYLIISGGSQFMGADREAKRCADTWVLDMNGYTWECLDQGIDTLAYPLKPHVQYCAGFGNRLFTLKPNREEQLDELEVIETAMPEDIEGLKLQARKENDIVSALEILDDAVCTTNSIDVAWRAPTKNADRIERYKLLMATTTGVVKEVYQGPESRFKVTGLRSNHEYVVVVKSVYNDGSFLYSDSKSFRTRASR